MVTPEISHKAYIWVNIDFDKVKNRINLVSFKIEQVIQKYQFSTKAGDCAKRNN
ncbi:MAG: hypothetical protein PUP90_31990 [Nostoc sp. S4]|nr:hypothetical protein [Nostoc sp. S4]